MNKAVTLAIISVLHLCFANHACGQRNEVKTVYFATNSSALSERYLLELNKIGQKCMSDSFSYLKIFAYTSKKGTRKYNEQLSKRRADAVFKYLTTNFRIDSSRIYTTWLGEESEGYYELHFREAKVQQACVDVLVFFRKPKHAN